MGRLLLLSVLVLSIDAGASQIIQISNNGNTVAVSQSDDLRGFIVGDYACIYHKQQEMACGTITKTTLKGAILKLDFRRENLHRGDKVSLGRKAKAVPRTPAAVPAESVASSRRRRTEAQFDLTVGATASPSYVVPILHFQAMVSEEFALGIQPSYVSQAVEDTQLKAIAALLTASYYGLGNFNGLWVQAGAGMYFFSVTAPGTEEKANALALLGTVGYRAHLTTAINAGIGVGVQYIASPTTQAVSFEYSTVQPLGTIDIGVSF